MTALTMLRQVDLVEETGILAKQEQRQHRAPRQVTDKPHIQILDLGILEGPLPVSSHMLQEVEVQESPVVTTTDQMDQKVETDYPSLFQERHNIMQVVEVAQDSLTLHTKEFTPVV